MEEAALAFVIKGKQGFPRGRGGKALQLEGTVCAKTLRPGRHLQTGACRVPREVGVQGLCQMHVGR